MKKPLTFLFLFLLKMGIAQNVEIEGTIKITEGAQPGYILTSDADGVATWQPQILADRKQIFVTDFGAKGDDSTDDTNAFQTAIDSAAIQGGTVHIPVGSYRITQTLNVPAGVKLQGYGLGDGIENTPSNTKGSRIHFYGNQQFALVFNGDYVGCKNLTIVDKGGQATGGIHFLANSSKTGIGAAFQDLLLLDFKAGTSLQLTANGHTGIAFSSFENIHIRNAKKGIHLVVAADGSFINLVTFRSISIAGSDFDYGILIEGPLSTTDWYGVALEADCPTFGHLVLNTDGAVNFYGVEIVSKNINCSDQTVLVELNESSRGSYIHGSAGKGVIQDYGSNYIDLYGESDIGIRPSGNNLFQNAAFKGIQNNQIPFWEFKNCTGCVTPTSVTTEAAEWMNNHNVLKLTIGANQKVSLGPQNAYFTKAYQQKECLFGGMVKTVSTDIAIIPVYQSCGGGSFTSGSAYPNDGDWHYIGKTSELDPNPTCPPNPQFIFDNSAGSSPATVYLTTPAFVFNRGEKPALEAAPITSAGGIMTGTLSTAMLEVAAPTSLVLQLTNEANVFQISGTNTINSINPWTDIFPQGTILTLLFEESGLRVNHDNNSIKLLGAIDYLSEAYSTLKLVSLGDGKWQEVDRNCVGNCQATALQSLPNAQKVTLDTTTKITLTRPTNLTTAHPVKIYPNPTKYGIHIDLAIENNFQKHQFQLLDLNGRILLKKSLPTTQNWIDFTAMNLAAGHYQVLIFKGKEAIHNSSLVVIAE